MTKLTSGKLKNFVQQAKSTKWKHIGIIVVLAIVLLVLYLLGIIKKGFAIGLGIILLLALGIQIFDYDLDLGTLWRTGSIEQSRIQYTDNGIALMGSCVKPQGSTKSYDLDCANFATQAEAQAKYDQCADEIASYNAGKSAAQIKSLDIYGLDHDKDGIVCEALPKS